MWVSGAGGRGFQQLDVVDSVCTRSGNDCTYSQWVFRELPFYVCMLKMIRLAKVAAFSCETGLQLFTFSEGLFVPGMKRTVENAWYRAQGLHLNIGSQWS